MALFEDILKKANTPSEASDDKTVEQQIDIEFDRLMADRDYLNQKFCWYSLDQTQKDFYIREAIRGTARQNVMKPILEARRIAQEEQREKDRAAYLVKMSGDKSVLLYVDGKRKQFVDMMKVKCPDCGEFLAVPSYYIGDKFWREHINNLAQKGKDDFLGVMYNEKKYPFECAACKTNHIVVVMVAP